MNSLVRRPITTILTVLVILFLALLGFFYLQEGSFEDAGARMDDTVSGLGEEVGVATNQVLDTTGDVIEDVADGPDETPN